MTVRSVVLLVWLWLWLIFVIFYEFGRAQAAAVPGYPLELTVTAYCLKANPTSLGYRVGHGVIAANGAAPYHSWLYVPGYGHGTVLDTGPLAANQIDVWVSDCWYAINVWERRRNVRVWRIT